MRIFLATSNKGKLREFRQILHGTAELEHIDMSIDERRSDDPEEIVRDKAERLSEATQKTVICDDSGLFIDSLNDFPGTCSAYIHNRIGLKGILKLMEGISQRGCEYRCAVAIASPGERAKSFLGTERGRISDAIKGEKGFGHDPIFIPEGYDQTYAEMENPGEIKKFRRDAVLKLVDWIKDKVNK